MKPVFHAQGVIVPLLTPFMDDGKINTGSLKTHIRWLAQKGVSAVMPCGTTGEGPLLRVEERKFLLEQVVNAVDGQMDILAHVGDISLEKTIELAQHAERLEVDAISVVTPYFYRLSDNALIDHYQAVASGIVSLPVFLYNIPQNTGNAITVPVLHEILKRSPNVVGIKDSSGNFENLNSYIGHRNGAFQVICGSDGLLFQSLKKGAVAGVSGNANIFPEIVVGLYQAYRVGDMEKAATLQNQLDTIRTLLEDGGNISLMKRMLEHRGLKCGSVRPPLPEVSTQKVEEIQKQLIANKILKEVENDDK